MQTEERVILGHSGPRPLRGPLTWLVRVLLAVAWAGLCYLQVGLVGSQLFSGLPDDGLVGIQLVAAGLVYLPIALAAASVWLTQTKPMGFAVLVHVVAMVLSVLIWVM